MGFLIRALDGDPSAVTQPALPPLPTKVDEALVWAAIEFLRRTSLPIEPRKKWPDGGMPQYGVKGFIAPGHQAQPGKAVCVWGDAGWGGLVRRGKYHDSKFADDLLGACVKMVREWNPQPKPTWVCAYSRDPILRTTAPFVLGFQEGATVTREGMEEFLDAQEPGRFSKPIEEQLVGWNPDLTKQNEALH